LPGATQVFVLDEQIRPSAQSSLRAQAPFIDASFVHVPGQALLVLQYAPGAHCASMEHALPTDTTPVNTPLHNAEVRRVNTEQPAPLT
jgi:hypothetical protein